ncbi:MAG: type II toxin-antitoxin system RelE/ParE family toxin [Candidatus Coatesbacteria bacterium]
MNARRRVDIPADVRTYLSGLHPEHKRRIRAALRHIGEHPEDGKALELELTGLRTYHVKPYRIVYGEERGMIVVRGIGPRREIYEVLTESIRKRAG